MKFEDEADEEYWMDLAEEKGEELGVDTREGSVYMDAATGHCIRTAKFYSDLNQIDEMLAIDSCYGDILKEKAAMDGIYYYPASPSYWSAEFEGAVPEVGEQFMCGDYYLTWTTYNDGYYLMSEDVGLITNSLESGTELIPLDNIDDLESATLGELIVPGEDEEQDDHLRNRWREAKSGPAENSNAQQYKTWCESIEGIGRAKILPLWAGENTCKAVLYSSEGVNVSDALVAQVQNYIDPIEDGFEVVVDGVKYILSDGLGEGATDMGCHFLAVSAIPVNLTVSATIILKDGCTIEAARKAAREQMTAYLKKLALESGAETNIVRISSIGSIIEQIDEILDYEYSTLTINGSGGNLQIDADSVAVLLEVVFNAG